MLEIDGMNYHVGHGWLSEESRDYWRFIEEQLTARLMGWTD